MLVRFIHIKRLTVLILALINTPTLLANDKPGYVCGVSNGYPPYQYQSAEGETVGFDADVLRLVFAELKNTVSFEQMNWVDVMATLKFTDKLDCVGGMEINDSRQKHYRFTQPYYSRKIVLFTLADNDEIHQPEDLVGKRITGDRDSSFESLLQKRGLKQRVRIKQADSKDASMKLLKNGDFDAMIAPKAVGLHLAKQLNVKVKIVFESNEQSPVGIAVKKRQPHASRPAKPSPTVVD